MDAFTPRQTTELVCRIGTKKRHTRLDKLFVNSLISGPLIGFGCALYLNTISSPWFLTNAPGLIRTIGAAVFPIALVMVVLSGSDLITTSFMFMTVAYLQHRVRIFDVLKIWIITFLGNLTGSIAFVALIIGYGGVFSKEPFKSTALDLATMKAVDPGWYQIFLKAIGGCWLVNIAVFTSISAREVSSKVVAIWFPTVTFEALGLNHVVADMTFIAIAIWEGHPKITVKYYIWKALIPTLLGNWIGGCVCVGAVYWYLYLTGDMAGYVDFGVGKVTSAMEASGGPMPIKDVSPILNSSIGGELSFEKYGKPRAKHNTSLPTSSPPSSNEKANAHSLSDPPLPAVNNERTLDHNQDQDQDHSVP